ncbi:PepSY domain-containing protein [Actinomyces naeslundii]|uniref:PepSY domain-containing protein n=1 Tax=Actinomyces naeslundii TaxID=1655 RepID=UPI00094C483C|nr:PepSY domain-containing protein [Actinomyces naeslundii]OLO84835.1 hypothetical protein BKH12_05160 [Actinomyces naeslundii]OLO87712.1 hypothetical protein BKH11_02910 [Actinomyces naeslundii]OLO90290.1 hypothetical protein BKH09_09965 [Actinomyces naeslundii]OMG14701.1 hypothetical protein BKH08_00310 [Actinomyces naeslundii]
MNPTVAPSTSPPSLASRTMSLVRRWLSAVAGLILLAITLSGTALPYQAEIASSLSSSSYPRGAGPDEVSLPQAVATIESNHPGEPVLSATRGSDTIEVRTKRSAYAVGASTGVEIGRTAVAPAWSSVLDNLHRCLLSCEGPGHVRWMSQEIPHTRWWGEHQGLTVGGLVVGTSGVVLLVLVVSGLRVWWPLQRYRRTVLSTRWRTQRLSRDTDLLKAAGLVLLPLLFLWGYYASAYGIHPAWPTSRAPATEVGAPTGNTRASQDQDTGPSRAVAAAQETRGGEPVALFLPEPNDPSSTYTVWLSQGTLSSRQRPVTSVTVSVDPDTGRTTVPSGAGREQTARAD